MNLSQGNVTIKPFSVAISGQNSTIGNSGSSLYTASPGRKAIYIKNNSDVIVYWGFSDSTCYNPLSTPINGGDGGEIVINIDASVTLYVRAASGANKTVTYAEFI